ncbi:hypothetical protein [Youxingia wuxianensis]|uniref:Uncharacterized protein n=1 Tax=Youxingia wuxianensis TaxID=2763678 RepID=A0A926EMU3_9FIRM|nr:hypothetical protein [Youxingia wuxianensis]MBC8584571.1 hypothetical protein [Youxingia wuxianensis]
MESKTPSVYTTLVLVTDQFECERIIKAGRVIADLSKTSYAVLSVMHTGARTNPAALEHLFSVAKEYDAEMTITFSDNPKSTIMHFIRDNKVINAITGIPGGEDSILVKMWKKLLNVTFFTVGRNGELHEVIDREYHPVNINI